MNKAVACPQCGKPCADARGLTIHHARAHGPKREVPRPLVAFRLETAQELDAIRGVAEKHADGNVSRLVREALHAQYPELERYA